MAAMKKRYLASIIIMYLYSNILPAQVDSLWMKINNQKDTTGLFAGYTALIKHYQLKNQDTLMFLSNQLIKKAKESGSKKYEYIGFKNLADALYNKGEYAEAINTDEKILTFETELTPEDKSIVLNDIGRAYRRLGNYPKAMEFFLLSKDIAHSENLIGMEATVYLNMSLVLSGEGKDSLVMDYLVKSLEMHREAKDSAGIAMCYSNIGSDYLNRGMITEAKNNFKSAMEISLAIKDKKQLGFAYENMGSLALEERDFKSALTYFNKAIFMYESINVPVYVAEMKEALGRLYYATGSYSLAIKNASESLKTGERLNSPELITSSATLLSDIYRKLNDYRNALYYFEVATKANTNFLILENNDALKNAEERFMLEKKRLEVISLEKVLKIEQANANLQRLYIYALVFGMIALLTIIVILWLSKRQKQKANKILQQSRETIELQNKELKQLNSVKDKLFSIIAHDLSGPLSNANGFLQLLQTTRLDEEKTANFLRSLSLQFSAISYLLQNLLHWSKSQFSGIVPIREPIEMKILIKEAIQLLQGMASSKDIAFQINTTDILVLADVEMVRLVLRNLLSNAIKYSSAGSQVLIESKQEDGFGCFSIIDHGKGIPASHMDRIFKLDVALTQGTQQEKGTGLGLILCREFVVANGGKIWFESRENIGSTFTFSLPVYNPQR